jgi:hypothetical protein
MRHGNCGNLGKVGNVESVTCRAHYLRDESNPPSPLHSFLSDVVRKHYSAWVSERQAEITKVLKEAFEGKPKPKLTAIKGGRT